LAASKGCPDPILELQSAVPTVRDVREVTGAGVSGVADGRLAAIPVPMFEVQSGVATVLVVWLFVRRHFVSLVLTL